MKKSPEFPSAMWQDLHLIPSYNDKILEHWRERGASEADAADLYMISAYTVVDPSQAADFGLQALQRWPNHNSLMYQTHRTLLWAGRILEGERSGRPF